VSDWADGQRPKRGRGRIYRIAYAGNDKASPKPLLSGAGSDKWLAQLAQLDSESYAERCDAQAALQRRGRDALAGALKTGGLGARGRWHAIWALAHSAGPAAIDDLLS